NATSEQLAAGKANDTAAYMDQLRQEEFANQQSAAAGRIDYLNAILNLPKNKGKKKKNNGRGGGTSGGALNGAGSGGSAGGGSTGGTSDYYEDAAGAAKGIRRW
ncbi:MAG: hypothetical protein RR893_13495, partial [Clostridia bacterium]